MDRRVCDSCLYCGEGVISTDGGVPGNNRACRALPPVAVSIPQQHPMTGQMSVAIAYVLPAVEPDSFCSLWTAEAVMMN